MLQSFSHTSGPVESAADSPEAALEVGLIAFAVCEAGAGRLGSADAAAVYAPVHLRLVEAKHLQVKEKHKHMRQLMTLVYWEEKEWHYRWDACHGKMGQVHNITKDDKSNF